MIGPAQMMQCACWGQAQLLHFIDVAPITLRRIFVSTFCESVFRNLRFISADNKSEQAMCPRIKVTLREHSELNIHGRISPKRQGRGEWLSKARTIKLLRLEGAGYRCKVPQRRVQIGMFEASATRSFPPDFTPLVTGCRFYRSVDSVFQLCTFVGS